MKHIALASQIAIDIATARSQRAIARKLIKQGRELRKQSRMDIPHNGGGPFGLAEQTQQDRARRAHLLSQGWECHAAGMDLQSEAKSVARHRRHQALAAAMLNGRSYLQCEKTCNPKDKPSSAKIGAFIAPYLAEATAPHAAYIAERWLTSGTTNLKVHLGASVGHLIDLDKKKAEIIAQRAACHLAEQNLRGKTDAALRYAREAEVMRRQALAAEGDKEALMKRRDEQNARLVQLEAELAALSTPK